MSRFVVALLVLLAGAQARAEEQKSDFGFMFDIATMYECRVKDPCEDPGPDKKFVTDAVITVVQCGGASHEAGIRPGDEIVAINGIVLHQMSLSRFQTLLEEDMKQDSIKLWLLRRRGEEFYGGMFTLRRKIASGVCRKGGDI